MRERILKADVLLPILAMLAVLVAASGARPTVHVIADPNAAESDREAAKALAEGKVEAREWLKNDKHIVWKWDRKAALKAVNELYAAGAKNVWVVNITKEEGGAELAAQFVTELPTEKPAREKVFAWIAKWEKKVDIDDEDRTKDAGQKYFTLSTDL